MAFPSGSTRGLNRIFLGMMSENQAATCIVQADWGSHHPKVRTPDHAPDTHAHVRSDSEQVISAAGGMRQNVLV